jgi:predicted DNA-binding transcriptional regulator AlpA
MRLLTYEDLHTLKGISFTKTWIVELMKRDLFPRALKITNQSIAWREDEVDTWIESRPRAQYAAPVERPRKKRRAPKLRAV